MQESSRLVSPAVVPDGTDGIILLIDVHMPFVISHSPEDHLVIEMTPLDIEYTKNGIGQV